MQFLINLGPLSGAPYTSKSKAMSLSSPVTTGPPAGQPLTGQSPADGPTHTCTQQTEAGFAVAVGQEGGGAIPDGSTLFRDDIFEATCQKMHSKNEAWVVKDKMKKETCLVSCSCS